MNIITAGRKLKRKIAQRLNPYNPQASGPTGLAKRWLSVMDYAEQFQTTWHPIYPELRLPCWKPVCYWGRHRPKLQKQLKTHIPPTGILEIPDGQVMDIQGYTFGRDDYFLPDLSFHRDRLEHAYLPKEKYPLKKLDGRCLSLMTNASNNYCHFLLDALPRLHLFEKAGIIPNEMDWIHVPQPISENAWSIFRKLGLDESKCIWAERHVGIQADMLYAATHPGLYLNYPRWVVDFWQASIRCQPTQPWRRFYLPRPKGRRRVVNEEELYPMLQDYDFEILSIETVINQPQLFHEAEAIVASHGAALANLVFCQPGTKVLELMSLEHPMPYFYVLSHLAGLEHGCIFGPTVEPRKTKKGLCFNDFIINPHDVKAALRALFD